MKRVCLCCGNTNNEDMFEASSFTKCMICGDTAVEYNREEDDIEEIVFVD